MINKPTVWPDQHHALTETYRHALWNLRRDTKVRTFAAVQEIAEARLSPSNAFTICVVCDVGRGLVTKNP